MSPTWGGERWISFRKSHIRKRSHAWGLFGAHGGIRALLQSSFGSGALSSPLAEYFHLQKQRSKPTSSPKWNAGGMQEHSNASWHLRKPCHGLCTPAQRQEQTPHFTFSPTTSFSARTQSLRVEKPLRFIKSNPVLPC